MGDVVIERLEDQISWYDDRSKRNQRRFKGLKYLEIVAAALIPILAAFSGIPQWVAAILGGMVVVCEAVLHLNKYHENWLTYRSTAEALKHEKFLYLAHAGAYTAANPRVLLAERIEALVAGENTKWFSHQQEAAAPAQESAEPT